MELTERQKWALYQIVNGLRKDNVPEQTLGGYAGTGKAQPLSSLIATPKGFVRMGDIKAKHEVCTPSGRIAKVTKVFPQGIKQIFRVSFYDGNSVECCQDHLWKIIVSDKELSNPEEFDHTSEVMPLWDIINCLDCGKNVYIENSKPVEFESQKVKMDPYSLGTILGSESELKIQSFVNELKEMNLFDVRHESKFVPINYLQNNNKIRLAVLQGIMDAGGSVDVSRKLATISIVSPKLASDIAFLVESLGGTCQLIKKNPECRYVGDVARGQERFDLEISLSNEIQLFKIEEKHNDFKNCSNSKIYRRIFWVDFIREEEAKCIMINDPDHLYLTNHFIPTHNTTLIKYLTKFFPNFAVAAYTGKAANVLRKKGISATTIHRRIYKPFFDNGTMYFDLNPNPDCDGFIIDESSMVSKEIYEDLLTFKLPIVFVGDHGQLEPVDSNFNLMKNPDYTLEEIHRNAGDIAKFAEHLRKGLPSRSYKPTDGKVRFLYSKITDDQLMNADQIICAFNKTRTEYNNRVRNIYGHKNTVEIGERVMCLKNNIKNGLFNGMQGKVINLYVGKYGKKYMDFEFDDIVIKDIWYDDSCFGQEKYKFRHGSDTPNPFDYAYCITAHKSQGDEFAKVFVIEQKCKNWEHKRWAYTAASRPKEDLLWKIG